MCSYFLYDLCIIFVSDYNNVEIKTRGQKEVALMAWGCSGREWLESVELN